MVENQIFIESVIVEYLLPFLLYFLAFITAYLAFKKWRYHDRIKKLHGKYRDEVLLYTATWSVRGSQVQNLLEQQMVSFTKLDTDLSDEAHNELKTLGIRVLPVLIIDGNIIKGLQPEKMFRLLTELKS